MAETATKLPVKTEGKTAEPASSLDVWHPFEGLRHEVDRLFDDFGSGFWRFPFRRSIFDLEPVWRREVRWAAVPAVDIVEKDRQYEITAELPGLDESNIEVKVSNGGLTIKGEKKEERRRRRRTITSPSAGLDRSSAVSGCRKASTPIRSKRASRRVCSR